ncbi:MAG: hypothetical protein QOD71_3505 [Thermoleophilaceae bacterium]|jgi:predicted nucleotide-binding protein|nr:hypothetical protein [Thermoleophilaceae bacterium]
MAKRPPGQEDPPQGPALTGTTARAKELIDRARQEASELLTHADQVNNLEAYEAWTHTVERWDARTKMALQTVFDGPWPEEFERAATGRMFRRVGQSPDETLEYRKEAVRRGVHMLDSIEERMEFLAEQGAVVESSPRTPGGRQVFVVHGHDRETRERVARLLEQLDLEPVILEEQTDRGRTIIEKFEQHALNVGFAVVLMTPDDVAAKVGNPVPETPNRARQNVVLELGYFIGALGRSRVVALCAEGIERPSDIHGVLYIDISREGWELRLAKEMRDAELPVDLNRL